MRRHAIKKLRPGLERFEEKLLPSAGALTTHVAALKEVPGALAERPASPAASDGGVQESAQGRRPQSPGKGFTLYRITNPTPTNALLIPPFHQVLVQTAQPIPGQVYNVFSISVRNGTARTFDASSNFKVKLTGQGRPLPILTGDEQWKPGQVFVFYVLTKKYYPVSPVTSAGFQFDFNGSSGIAIPGPSAIFLRVKYNPDTFERVLNWITIRGPGAKGHRLGLPDTSIWEFVSSKTDIQSL